MGEDVIPEVSGEDTAKGIWDKLEELCLKKSLTNRLILLKMLFTFNIMEGSTAHVHLNTFDDHIMKLKSADLKLEEESLAMILLLSLPNRYTGFANSMIYERDTIMLSDVKTGVLSEDLRKQIKNIGDDSHVSSSS